MADLLTTKEVQALLKVDRTTVYRMLKDGGLRGVTIGQQWRFPLEEVEALLSVREVEPTSERKFDVSALPLHCMTPIQDVFAEIAGVGAVTTDIEGQPLTEISNSCQFCNLILASEKGRAGCIASWRRLAQQAEHRPQFVTCHAGLQYARARIEINGDFMAMLIAGQFYASPPDPMEEAERVRSLAWRYDVDEAELRQAVVSVKVLDDDMRERIGGWLERVAHTFEDIGRERADLIGRLQRIAQMSALENV